MFQYHGKTKGNKSNSKNSIILNISISRKKYFTNKNLKWPKLSINVTNGYKVWFNANCFSSTNNEEKL